MKELQCGVIGLGRLGMKHALTLAGMCGAKLSAVYDTLPEQCAKLQERVSGVRVCTDYHDMFSAKDVDAVVIASPTSLHATMLMEAMESGKFIFCEKPLTLDADEMNMLQATYEKTHAFVQVGFMRRFDAAYVEAKRRIDSGELGEPVSMRCVSRDPSCPPIEFAKKSGGLVLDLCIHDIDLTHWFLGSTVERVHAHGGVLMYPELAAIDDIDHVDLELCCENGTLAAIEGSRNSHYGYDVRTEIVCTKGAVFIGAVQQEQCLVMTAHGQSQNTVQNFLDRFNNAYVRELEYFVETACAGTKPSVSVSEGLAAVRVATAANASLKTGMTVKCV
ncbi:MAG: Gfo/Idh/MocA family oxidoreductase [Treponema sp.]|nr:Gfo/Idh/MocA family oxidoreductase [Treponema sp.]